MTVRMRHRQLIRNVTCRSHAAQNPPRTAITRKVDREPAKGVHRDPIDTLSGTFQKRNPLLDRENSIFLGIIDYKILWLILYLIDLNLREQKMTGVFG